ncbi:MAG TPA: hypothetical protein VGK73_18020 [Polyangiaceae bacterium]
MKAVAYAILPSLGLCALPVRAATDPGRPPLTAEPRPVVEAPLPADLRSPEQRDRRKSAYTLPARTWAFEVGALGLGGGEVFAKLGIAYGFGAGLEMEANLAHAGVGLLNVSSAWSFLDTRYFDARVVVGFWYGRGEWFWLAQGATKELISKIDVIEIPMGFDTSLPLSRGLQLDFGVEYRHGEVFGSVGSSDTLYFDAELGIRQFQVRPGLRLFLSRRVELALSSDLPLYSAVPAAASLETESRSREGTGFETVPFSSVWSMEGVLRSRFAEGVFGSVRLHYSKVARGLYGTAFSPSFALEFRP